MLFCGVCFHVNSTQHLLHAEKHYRHLAIISIYTGWWRGGVGCLCLALLGPSMTAARTESVAEKMLTNWFTFLLYKFLKV